MVAIDVGSPDSTLIPRSSPHHHLMTHRSASAGVVHKVGPLPQAVCELAAVFHFPENNNAAVKLFTVRRERSARLLTDWWILGARYRKHDGD